MNHNTSQEDYRIPKSYHCKVHVYGKQRMCADVIPCNVLQRPETKLQFNIFQIIIKINQQFRSQMINREVTTCHATSLAKKILKNLKFLHELVMIKTFYLKKG
jgi:disulfide oxidoreductase YuzD